MVTFTQYLQHLNILTMSREKTSEDYRADILKHPGLQTMYVDLALNLDPELFADTIRAIDHAVNLTFPRERQPIPREIVRQRISAISRLFAEVLGDESASYLIGPIADACGFPNIAKRNRRKADGR